MDLSLLLQKLRFSIEQHQPIPTLNIFLKILNDDSKN
jgi:hypothetical protein